MNVLITIAWRNIWRHPGRSGVLIAAIVAGLWAGVITVGTMNGMLDQRLNYLIESEITHVQIHHPEYRTERRPTDFIKDYDAITLHLKEDERVKSFASRILADGMLQTPVKAAGVQIRGVDVEAERQTTTFHENMTEGEYPDTDMRNAVIIGEALAAEHNMRVGNRIVLTFEDTNNELTSAAFNISGLFRSASTDYDERNVFVRNSDLASLISNEPVFHEIAIMLHDVDDARSVANDLNHSFGGIEAQTWNQISPELSTIVELGGVMLFLVTGIIMLALAFGILNTMLMALFERMQEISMLLSIGMSRMRVFMMIMLESVIITLTGAAAGIGLAWLSVNWLSERGVNFEMFADGIAELGWDHLVYPFLGTNEYIAIISLVIVIAMLSSVWPALKATRVKTA